VGLYYYQGNPANCLGLNLAKPDMNGCRLSSAEVVAGLYKPKSTTTAFQKLKMMHFRR